MEDRDCMNLEKDIEEEYDMMPLSPENMDIAMMPMQNYMMQGMGNMQGMNPMQCGMPMMGMCPMQNNMPMMGMCPMQCGMDMMNMMQGMNYMPYQNMQKMMYNEEDMSSSSEQCEIREEERYKQKDVDKILNKIEKYNPGVFRLMRTYGVPYQVAKRICRRIINLTLMYYDDKK